MEFFRRFKIIFIDGSGFRMLAYGLMFTLLLTVAALALGLILGVLCATVKVVPKKNLGMKILNGITETYITIFRGTPIMVQLLVVAFAILAPLRLPDMLIAVLVFGLNSGAYLAESIRAGILAVDKGQTEAGRSLGLSYGTTMMRIVLPQAIKNILPALANEFIALLKETSVAGAAISVMELTKETQLIVAKHNEAFVPYIMLALIYLGIVMIATHFIKKLERKLREGDNR